MSERQEIIDLVAKARDGDQAAMARICKLYKNVVLSVATRERRIEFDDAIQEGYIGLLRATKTYDPTKGTKFSTYALWWVRHTINRTAVNTCQMVRTPAYLVTRDLDNDEKTINRDRAKIAMRRHASLNVSGLLLKKREAEVSRGCESSVEHIMALREALEVAKELPELQGEVIRRRLWEDQTLQQIADDLGFTREWSRQLFEAALNTIRKTLMRRRLRRELEQRTGRLG